MAGSAEDLKKHITHYWMVFGALCVLTVATVGASYLEVGVVATFVIGLGIASTKSTLVAAIFMHLAYDKNRLLMWTLLLTAFFFAVLLLVPMLTAGDSIGTPVEG
jgi:caa(3)-type oxidase subunit IV